MKIKLSKAQWEKIGKTAGWRFALYDEETGDMPPTDQGQMAEEAAAARENAPGTPFHFVVTVNHVIRLFQSWGYKVENLDENNIDVANLKIYRTQMDSGKMQNVQIKPQEKIQQPVGNTPQLAKSETLTTKLSNIFIENWDKRTGN